MGGYRYILLFACLMATQSILKGQDSDSSNRIIDQVVVTAQIEPTSLKNSVYKIRTITHEQIQRRATADITTLLNTELGIRFSNDMALGETDVQLMGMSGQNVKVLVDGVPLLDRGATKQSLTQIDVNTIEKIEIIEGPVSVVYGTDALAGVINILTNNNSDNKKWHIQARVLEETANKEYTLFINEGRHNAYIGLSHQLDQNWRVSTNLSRNTFGGWKGNNTGRSLSWQPKDQWLGGARVAYKNEKHETWYRLDYTNEDIYTPGNYNANNTYIDKNFITNRYTNILQSNWNLSDRWSANGTVSYQNYTRETVTKRTYLETNETQLTTGAGEQDIAKFDNLFFRGTAQYKLSQHVFAQAGLEYDREYGAGERLNDNAVLTEYALFLTTEIKAFPWMNVRPGLRFVGNSVFDAPPVIPSLNTKFILSESFDFRAAYARGFRSPALRELFFTFFDTNHSIRGNENLQPEYSNSFNTYLSYHKQVNESSDLSASIGGFYNLFDNMITMGIDPEDGSVNTYINLQKYKTTGIVWENNYTYRNLQLGLGFSYIGRYNRLYEEDSNLDQFLWTPEVNSSIFYTIPKWGTNINLFYKFYGKRPGFETGTNSSGETEINQIYSGSFNQADLTLNKRINTMLDLHVGVRNLFNTINVVNTGTVGDGAHSVVNSSVPMSYGRSFFLGLQFNMSR